MCSRVKGKWKELETLQEALVDLGRAPFRYPLREILAGPKSKYDDLIPRWIL